MREQRAVGRVGGGPQPRHPPVFEGVVDDGFEHQAVSNLRRSPKVEHLDGPQRGVGMAQPAVGTGVTPQMWPQAMAAPCSLPNPARDKETPKKWHPWIPAAKASHEKEQRANCNECEHFPGVPQHQTAVGLPVQCHPCWGPSLWSVQTQPRVPPGVSSPEPEPLVGSPGCDGGHVLHPGHDLPTEGVALVVGVWRQHQLHALHPRPFRRHRPAAVPRLPLCHGGRTGFRVLYGQ